MDIASLATSISQQSLSNSVAVAVARKTLDAQKQQGEAAIELLEAARETASGASPDGVGGRVAVAA